MEGKYIMDTSFLQTWAGLVGVILGFGLGEGTRLIREKVRINQLKKLIRDELLSMRYQIPQKRQVLDDMTAALNKHEILPGDSVSIISTGYRQHISELYEHLSLKQRNCLHVIYQRLEISENLMNGFF
jgi:hypothetical protein